MDIILHGVCLQIQQSVTGALQMAVPDADCGLPLQASFSGTSHLESMVVIYFGL